MGGKHKQAQRTKGNVKPSSSGRSAVLLGNISFDGFGGPKNNGIVFPFQTLNISEDKDGNIDSNYQIVLKKMSKKDSTTRLKALQEFATLVENSEVEVVKNILPFWPRLYCMLAGDGEHRVREASHEAHRKVLLQVKRNMAPYLRQLIGPWFTGQFDTYSPAASAATHAFQDGFPPNKLSEVIVFCEEEILKYICDNLLEQSTDTSSNDSGRERIDKQERVLVTCLQGYVHFIHIVPKESLGSESFIQISRKLLNSTQFWSLAKSKSPVVRCSWMTAIKAVIEKSPQLLDDHHCKVVKVIFERLDETDSVVLPAVWHAALNVITTIKDWHLYCNVEKHVFPRLWSILKEGGHGNAASIFPNVLPMLNSLLLVKKDSSDQNRIMDTLLSCLQDGIMKKSVIHSHAESDAVVRCYIDCLQYVADGSIYEGNIIDIHVIPMIEIALTERKLHLFSKILFKNLSALLHSWSNSEESTYRTLYNLFWSKLLTVFSKLSMQSVESDYRLYTLSQEVKLCLWLRDPNAKPEKSLRKVRFSLEQEETSPLNNCVDGSSQALDDSVFNHELMTFIKQVCSTYLNKVKQENSLCYMVPLLKLITVFNSSELLNSLTSSCNTEELLRNLLGECVHCSTDLVQTTVEFALCMSQFLSFQEQDSILRMMSYNSEVLIWILRAAQKTDAYAYLLKWLQCSFLSKLLISLTSQLHTESESLNARTILMECTANISGKGFLINAQTLSLILKELCKELHETDVSTFAAEFLSALCTSILQNSSDGENCSADELTDSIFQIVLALFCKCCNIESMSAIPEDVFSIMTKSWQDGVIILCNLKSANIELLSKNFSEIMKENLLAKNCVSQEVFCLVNSAAKFLITVSSHLPLLELCSAFLNGILSEYCSCEHHLRIICENAEILLYSPDYEIPTNHAETDFPNVHHYMIQSIFTTALIVEVLLYIKGVNSVENNKDVSDINSFYERKGSAVDREEEETEEIITAAKNSEELSQREVTNIGSQFQEEPNLTNFDLLENRILQVAFSMAVCNMFTVYFQSTPYYSAIEVYVSHLKSSFEKLNVLLHENGKIEIIKNKALQKAQKDGGMWIHTVYLLNETEERIEIFKSLEHSTYAEYSAQILLKMADANYEKIPLTLFDENCSTTIITFWLHHMQELVDNENIVTVLRPFDSWSEKSRNELLYDCDISGKEWNHVKEVVKIMYYLSACIKKCPLSLDQKAWDFIMISTAYYTQNLSYICKHLFSTKAKENVHSTWDLSCNFVSTAGIFSMAALDLLNNLTLFCENVEREDYSEKKEMFQEIVNEWKNVFADDVHKVIFNIYTAASASTPHKPSLLGHLLLQRFSGTAMNMDVSTVLNQDNTGKLNVILLKSSCNLIHSSVVSLRVLSYNILKQFIPNLVNSDSHITNKQGIEETGSNTHKFSIQPLVDSILNIQAVVDTMLVDFSFGDSCIVQPHTDSYSYTVAYLLLWDLILEACREANSQLRYQYATVLRNLGYLPNLLDNLFFLMPAEILETASTKTKNTTVESMFADPPELSIDSVCTSQQLQHWACWVYYNALSRLPALVRQWWSDTKPKVSTVVQQATFQYVSPILCMRELLAIQNQTTEFKNMEVKVHPKAREVIAVYAVDDAQMELIVTLPEIYPLGIVQVDSHTSIVGTSHWRNWVKQLSIFLTHQNGSLWDGLLLWKSNLDKRFEGVEECYICFSILHGTNFQIPELCCKTCKKKFHAPCLYKWFSTSNKSTCPICRNIF